MNKRLPQDVDGTKDPVKRNACEKEQTIKTSKNRLALDAALAFLLNIGLWTRRELAWVVRVVRMRKLVTTLLGACLALLGGCTGIQRSFLFYPTHHTGGDGLEAWEVEAQTIGYCRKVKAPKSVWLMLHGNAGQAVDRTYALPHFSPHDSVFILEYPGYGARKGKPSKASFNAATVEAYELLRKTFPNTPICVLGESIGSGPACMLATRPAPPDKIVLVVPFDQLASVAKKHAPWLPVGLLLEANWDNIKSLSKYEGPVEIFGADQDLVIPVEHARKLADSFPAARFHSIPGGHNDWSKNSDVKIRNP
jgi:pimeloyl-ACP methyl ester carboxylesterase